MTDPGDPDPGDLPSDDLAAPGHRADVPAGGRGDALDGARDDVPSELPVARSPDAKVPGLLASTWPVILMLVVFVAALVLGRVGGRVGGRAGDIDDRPAPSTGHEDAAAAEAEPEVSEAGLLAFVAAGLVVLASLLRKRTRKWLIPPPRLAPRATWGLEQFAYGLALVIAFGVLGAQVAFVAFGRAVLEGSLVSLASQIAGCATVVALVVTRPRLAAVLEPATGVTRGGNARARLASLGLAAGRSGENALRGLAAGAAGLAVGYAGMRFGYVASEWLGHTPPTHPVIRRMLTAGPGEVAVLAAVACVAAPAVEEFLFRGFLYATLRDCLPGRQGALAGAAASSLVFAAVHRGLPGQAATFVLGLVLCAVYERAGTLVAPAVAHGVFNAAQVTLVVVGRCGR